MKLNNPITLDTIFSSILLSAELSSSTVAVAQYIVEHVDCDNCYDVELELELELYTVYAQMRKGTNSSLAAYSKLVLKEYLKLTGQEERL